VDEADDADANAVASLGFCRSRVTSSKCDDLAGAADGARIRGSGSGAGGAGGGNRTHSCGSGG
jgi:hypothetical protein